MGNMQMGNAQSIIPISINPMPMHPQMGNFMVGGVLPINNIIQN